MTASVTALLVSHDGARWLPAVLDAVASQTCRPDRVVGVDTGSKDASADLLQAAFGAAAVVSAPAHSSYGAAVTAGLAAHPGAADDWVWLLHDDSAPAPDALEQLLAVAADNPSAAILGPKLREWPSLRRLLEVGVTISGTGRRETGLERGEYDQGQHDRIRDTLAVNTAGMLVRRGVLESLGFDARLPIFGNDVDFGWRAARAGHRTMVVPDAVVFHVEAAHRGLRRTPVTTPSFHRAERQAALYTLLANCSARALPFVLVRLFLGSLVRALGFLLVRAPAEAGEEIAALGAVYVRPFRVLAARRRRRRSATVPARDVRHLLAAPWVPYRHGLDFLTDIASAVAMQASDLSAARRSRAVEATETGPVALEAQELPEDTGFVARTVRSPVAGLFALLMLLALASTRGLVGEGLLSGGALLPAPDTATSWWAAYTEQWHMIGIGSASPAAPYLLPLALAGTLLAGKAWLVLDLLFLLAVPLAAAGGYRFLRRVTGSKPMSMWGAATYGLLPVLSGAVAEGRLGTVAAAVVLPWLATSALYLGPDQSDDRRMRAAWRTALWLALLVAFVPVAWLLAVLVTGAVLVAGFRTDRARWSRRAVWSAVVLPVLAALVLLFPWTLLTWFHQGYASWLFEAGLPSPDLAHPLGSLDVVLDRPGVFGAPAWISWGVPLAAVASLLRPDTRAQVLRAWAVLAIAAVATAVLAVGSHALPSDPTAPQPLWLGFPLLLVAAAGITAAALAGTGIRRRLTGSAFGWRQPLGLVVVVLAVLSTSAGLVWWAVFGVGDGPLDRGAPSDVPVYMTDDAAIDPLHGVLVVRGSARTGFDYQLLRTSGLRTGDDSLLPSAQEQLPLTNLVANLVTEPQSADIESLSQHGVGYVYVPPPADPKLAANLDSVSGVTPGSPAQPGGRAWQLEATPTDEALPDQPRDLRAWLLVLQALAILTAAVFAAPTRKVER